MIMTVFLLEILCMHWSNKCVSSFAANMEQLIRDNPMLKDVPMIKLRNQINNEHKKLKLRFEKHHEMFTQNVSEFS